VACIFAVVSAAGAAVDLSSPLLHPENASKIELLSSKTLKNLFVLCCIMIGLGHNTTKKHFRFIVIGI